MLGEHDDFAARRDSVDPIVGGVGEEQLPLSIDCRTVRATVPLADDLPVFAGNERLVDVLT